MTSISSGEWLQRLLHTQRDLQRWERKHTALQQQLTHLTDTPLAPSPALSPPSSVPPPKRRVVTLAGVERTIPIDTASSPTPSPLPAPTPPTPSPFLQRDRRLLAGLRSHLTSASSLPPSHVPTPSSAPALSPRASLQLSLTRCSQLLAQLQRKERCGVWQWMRTVKEEAEELKAAWFWTREWDVEEEGGAGEGGKRVDEVVAAGGPRVSIAWRVREVSETWRVVMEEEAKHRKEARLQREKKAGTAADTAAAVDEQWTEEDERRLQDGLEEERRREVQPHAEVRKDQRGAARGGQGGRGGHPPFRERRGREELEGEAERDGSGKRRRGDEQHDGGDEAEERGISTGGQLEESEEDREVERLLSADS